MRDESFVQVTEAVVENPVSQLATDSLTIGGVIVAPVGPALGLVNGPSDFLAKYTANGVIPRNAHISLINAYYLSRIMPLVISRSLNSKLYGGARLTTTGLKPALFDELGQLVNYRKEKCSIKLGEFDSASKWNIVVEDLLLYHGEKPNFEDETKSWFLVESIQDVTTYLTTLGNFYFSDFKLPQDGDNTLEFTVASTQNTFSFSSEKAEDETEATSADLELESIYESTEDDILVSEEDLAYFKLNNVNTVSDLSLSISKGSNKKSDYAVLLKLKTKTELLSYQLSFDPEATDHLGTNVYLETLNDFDLPFTVQVVKEFGEVKGNYTLDNFGANGDTNSGAAEKLAAVNEAADKLVQQELYDIDGICCFGLQQSNADGARIVNSLYNVGVANKWFLPIGVPKEYTDRRSIYNWANSVNIPSPDPISGCIFLGPFDKDTTLVGWPVYIDPGCKYWERVSANRGLGKEFAPVFYDDQGEINMTSPVVRLGKTDRNILLNQTKPVLWIAFNPKTKLWYLNQNWTWQAVTKKDVTEEENIVRQMWKISRACDPICRQFFAKYNTRSTRKQLQDLVELWFQQNLENRQYAPVRIKVTCDTTNNTEEDIRNHLIKCCIEVQYQGSIKWAQVLNKAYPLGVDFESEM